MTGNQASYVDFDLYISPQGHVVANSIQGQAEADIAIDVPNTIRLALKLVEKDQTDADLLKDLGRDLYEWLFPVAIHTHLHQTEAAARVQGAGLRLRLRIEPETIARLPLEFLYRSIGDYFLATNPETVLSRYLNINLPPDKVRRHTGPLHMLALIAAPEDQPLFDTEEWEELLHDALARQISTGALTLRVVMHATRTEIRNALLEHIPDIVQFIGHGAMKEGQGHLALVDPATDGTWLLDEERFASLFLGYDAHLGLVSLTACESARSSDPQGFLGVAPRLVQRGIPAVLAMQYPIRVKSARVFFEDFYTALAMGKPVDWAVQAGRNAVALDVGLDRREFATPVLYMRAPDGDLFGFIENQIDAARIPGDLAVSTETVDLSGRGSPLEAVRSVEARQELGYIPPLTADHLIISSPIRIELVRIPAGEFLMGSLKRKDPLAYDEELPQHTLSLADFYISRYPVINAQFTAYVQTTGYRTTAEEQGFGWVWDGHSWKETEGADWRHPCGPQSDLQGKHDHPVVQVSWHDALAFCRWLTEQTGQHFTLPSEAEWEKVGRGTDGRLYPWGNDWDALKCNTSESNMGATTPVGRYSPQGDSPYGCADMVGNVWEWTRSLWGKDLSKPDWYYPYDLTDGREDLTAPNGVRRVLRGGSFLGSCRLARCACRDRDYPNHRNNHVGFRPVILLAYS